jgi:hypothetical protein
MLFGALGIEHNSESELIAHSPAGQLFHGEGVPGGQLSGVIASGEGSRQPLGLTIKTA